MIDDHYRHMGIQWLGRNAVYKIKDVSMNKEEEKQSEDYLSDIHTP